MNGCPIFPCFLTYPGLRIQEQDMVTESVVHQKRDSPFFVSTVPVQMKETRSSVGAALAHRDARPLLWLGDPRERERERGREGEREGGRATYHS